MKQFFYTIYGEYAMNVNLVGTQNSLNILKLCILYFDEINIEIPWFYDQSYRFHIENDFTNQLKYLKKYFNIKVSFLEFDMPGFHNIKKTSNHLLDIIIKNSDFIYENAIVKDNEAIIYGLNTKIRDKEFKKFIQQTFEPYVEYINHTFPFGDDMIINSNIGLIQYSEYYIGYQLGDLFNHISQKISFISDLQIINDLMVRSIDKIKWLSNLKEQINLNCISILLPNLSYSTFDDIFEMKIKMQSELLELQAFINSLWSGIDNEDIKNGEKIIINKINQSIRNLECKMKGIKISTVQKFISEIKNPLSYAPLIGSLFSNVPTSISLLTSLGFIGVNTGLDYIKQINNIKNDSMYFLFKLQK